jgi:hypothetical protein
MRLDPSLLGLLLQEIRIFHLLTDCLIVYLKLGHGKAMFLLNRPFQCLPLTALRRRLSMLFVQKSRLLWFPIRGSPMSHLPSYRIGRRDQSFRRRRQQVTLGRCLDCTRTPPLPSDVVPQHPSVVSVSATGRCRREQGERRLRSERRQRRRWFLHCLGHD